MSVVRVHKTNNFTVMSNFHFREKKMSLKAKGLLSLMLSLPDDWDYSVAGLATLSKDGKDSIMSALAELEKFGYLTRKRLINERGQFDGIEYNIFEKPVTDNPIEDCPTKAKPIEEKPQQLNTNSINDLEKELFMVLNTNDDELIELYCEYILAREKMNAPLNKTSLHKLIKRAKRLSKNNIRVEKVLLETALINGWKNVYLPREQELASINQEVADDLRALFGLEQKNSHHKKL